MFTDFYGNSVTFYSELFTRLLSTYNKFSRLRKGLNTNLTSTIEFSSENDKIQVDVTFPLGECVCIEMEIDIFTCKF